MPSLKPAKKTFSKKRIAHRILSKFYSLFSQQKKIVVFDAYSPFHMEHFFNVLNKLIKDNKVEVVVFGQSDPRLTMNDKITFYNTDAEFPVYKTVAVFISTDLYRIPHWFDCPSIFFGHGIGAKLNYAKSERINDYDYTFSASEPLYKVHSEQLSVERVFKIGLPILEDEEIDSASIFEYFGLDSDKPLVVYAPSWAIDISKISDVREITKFLDKHTSYNIIVSPHPLLFVPERCSGNKFFNSDENLQHVKLNVPSSPFSSLDLVKVSNLVLSDVSSILFEAMALDKAVIFDGNKEFFEYCDAMRIYEDVVNVCKAPDWNDMDDTTIADVLEHDDLALLRREFIDTYICNRGQATNKFVESVYQVISKN